MARVLVIGAERENPQRAAHPSRIGCTSVPGRGSTFTVELEAR